MEIKLILTGFLSLIVLSVILFTTNNLFFLAIIWSTSFIGIVYLSISRTLLSEHPAMNDSFILVPKKDPFNQSSSNSKRKTTSSYLHRK